MRPRKLLVWIGIVVLMTALIMIIYGLLQSENMKIGEINNNLYVGEIKLGMKESEVIERWGQGEYLEGFGSHGREYQGHGIRFSFADDHDNDLYGKVSSLEFSNPEYSVYAVKAGDSRERAVERILAAGFKKSSSPEILVHGEYSIILRGQEVIEAIGVTFSDKDLKDRIY